MNKASNYKPPELQRPLQRSLSSCLLLSLLLQGAITELIESVMKAQDHSSFSGLAVLNVTVLYNVHAMDIESVYFLSIYICEAEARTWKHAWYRSKGPSDYLSVAFKGLCYKRSWHSMGLKFGLRVFANCWYSLHHHWQVTSLIWAQCSFNPKLCIIAGNALNAARAVGFHFLTRHCIVVPLVVSADFGGTAMHV